MKQTSKRVAAAAGIIALLVIGTIALPIMQRARVEIDDGAGG